MIQFRKQFPKAKIITLTRNYRSSQTILDHAYQLIQNNNPDRLEVKEKIDKKLVATRKIKGEVPEFMFSNRVEDEADLVVEKIKELTQNSSKNSQLSTLNSQLSFRDFAILVRANDHSQPFVRALERARIPYQFLGPGRLFQREEIKDLIAYLKVLYNFEDSTSLYRVLTIPQFGLASVEIAALLNLAKRRNYTLFEAMEKVDEIFLKDPAKEKVKKIVTMIKRHLKLLTKDTAGQILYYFLTDTGIIKKLIETKGNKDEQKARNIAKFFDKLKSFEVEHDDASVFAVVEWIDLSMQMGESPLATDIDWAENNAVNILTIHSSKGLEFPIVFLVNLVNQRFPTRDRREQIPIPKELIKEILPEGDAHMEEERRLFYVGVTRARDQLFLTAAKYYGEGKRERKLSPFVYETLGEDFVERTTSNERRATTQLTLLDWSQPITESPPLITHNSPPITYLSYSQIQTFDICPLHYKLRYILKIPVPNSSAQSFGSSVHSVLRDFYQRYMQKQSVSPKIMVELLNKNWINEGYSSKAHEQKARKQALALVSRYVERNFSPKALPPLALELPFQFMVKGLKIGGRIDRIDKVDDKKIEILDYKTGTNIPDERYLKDDLQLTVYALAATEVNDRLLNKKPEEVVLSLYYLEQDKKLTTTRTQEQLEIAKKHILELAKQIEQSEFTCSGSSLCKTCEYKILCSV